MRHARLLTPGGSVSGVYDSGQIKTDSGQYQVGRDGRLLPPCEPSAVYCVGRNFAATLDQMDYERPEEPDFFIKPPTSLLAHGQTIPYPTFTDELTYAGELAAVIDTRCRDVDEGDVPDVVRGYTILNDIDALDQHGRTPRKAFDGSAPLGPWIEANIDPRAIEMTTRINDELRQDANTERMLFGPHEVVSYLSERFTFQPGDVISFGSPANPGLIEPGDEIAIEYEGVGTLENTVRR